MKRTITLLVLLGATLALAGSLAFSPHPTTYQFRPCTGTGKPWDGGTVAGYRLPEGKYVALCTNSDCYLKAYDGGTAPDGCNDGGSCYTASIAYNGSDMRLQQGSQWVLDVPRGGMGITCASDGGAWLDIVKREAP